MANKTAVDVADKAIDKVSDLISSAADKAGDIFQASSEIITNAIEKYGQQAIDAVLWVVRIDAAQVLFSGFLLFFLAFLSIYLLKNKLKVDRGWYNGGYKEDSMFKFLFMWGSTIAICWMFVLGFKIVTNVWYYVAVAKPEIYLVKQVVDVVKQKANVPK